MVTRTRLNVTLYVIVCLVLFNFAHNTKCIYRRTYFLLTDQSTKCTQQSGVAITLLEMSKSYPARDTDYPD
jgi:hypothetical protein